MQGFSYTAGMSKTFQPGALQVRAFAQAGATLSSTDPLARYPRLNEDAQSTEAEFSVSWTATGESRPQTGADDEVWLHLQATASVPLTCQRCLGMVAVPLAFDRWFRFVADEATAELLDDEVEEDLLALSADFDLLGLVEDELLMELPIVPTHEVCPTELPYLGAGGDADAEEPGEGKPNPFAVLAKLRTGKLN